MTRLLIYAALAVILGLGALLACIALSPTGGPLASRQKPPPPHHTAGGFRNLHLPPQSRSRDFWRWRLGLGPREETALPRDEASEALPERVPPDQNQLHHPNPGKIAVTWIGHSTALIQVAGLNILTDPMFSQRASPISFAGPRRLVPPGIPLAELPPVHAAVISHNHYDHLDAASVRQLGPNVRFFVPLGLKAWFEKQGLRNVTELDWGEHATLGEVRFHCLPAQHFAMRTPFDQNRALWCSWVLATPAGPIFFAGDTGYCPEFADIGQRFGPIRLALLPIGGYMPRWFMHSMHVNPAEAVKIHQDLRSQLSIGIHWGTFRLTDEPVGEPPRFLRKVLEQQGIPPERFMVLRLGETRED